jgi:hypothetical protein
MQSTTVSIVTAAVSFALLLSVVADSSGQAPKPAKASSTWFYDWDQQTQCRLCAEGGWTLGENTVEFSGVTTKKGGPIKGVYPNTDTLLVEDKRFGAEAWALSALWVTGQQTKCPLYKLQLDAVADGVWGTSAAATARGADPQMMLDNAVIGQFVGLDVGSSLFEPRPEVDEAYSRSAITAFGIAGPLATIDIASVRGLVEATVNFNADPRLRFLNSATLAPITASEVEAILESSPMLGTDAGLDARLDLFKYEYDLTTTPLPPGGAFFGTDAISHAFSPEENADYNGNGTIDGADYVVWRNTRGQMDEGDGLPADGNGNGIVDPFDYRIWRGNFGYGGAGSATVLSVPEPSGLLVLSLAGLALVARSSLRNRTASTRFC